MIVLLAHERRRDPVEILDGRDDVLALAVRTETKSSSRTSRSRTSASRPRHRGAEVVDDVADLAQAAAVDQRAASEARVFSVVG